MISVEKIRKCNSVDELQELGKSEKGCSCKNININICDFCKENGKDISAVIDGKTIYGPWAGMCLDCAKKYGKGLGTGIGQVFV